MRFEDILQERGISRYYLSKTSGVPWATLANIYSGKTRLERCNASTLLKLSKALNISIEELLEVDNSPSPKAVDGKPARKNYLESGLPASIQKAIDDYIQGEKDRVPYLDCLSDELYGAVNSNLWGGRINE